MLLHRLWKLQSGIKCQPAGPIRRGRNLCILLILLASAIGVPAQEGRFRPVVARQTLVIERPRAESDAIAVPLPETDAPFVAVGLGWSAGSGVTVSLRASPDGDFRGAWQQAEPDGDATEGSVAGPGAMLILPASTRYIQYRIERNGDRRLADWPTFLRLSFFDPGTTPQALRDEYLNRFLTKMKEADEEYLTGQGGPVPRPPVITRAEWGVPASPAQPPAYTTVTHLIVHHTVDNNSSPDWAAVVRAIWNFHVLDRGYNDIGYNYLIDPNGLVYEGRGGGDNVQGAHFSGVNGNTMGVALLGTFTETAPTAKALDSLKRLLAWKAAQRGLVSFSATTHAASGLMLNVISGHRDGPSPTECPGAVLYGLLPRLRAETHNHIAGAGYVTTVSAASYKGDSLAGESIVAAFGVGLAGSTATASSLPLPVSLGGVSVRIRDRRNAEFTAGLFYVSPTQVNFLLPGGMAEGPATVLIDNGNGLVSAGTVRAASVAPSIFTANSDGEGVPSALLLRVRPDGSASYTPVAVFDSALRRFLPVRIDPGPVSDQVFLVLFGTGLRNRSSLSAVNARLGDLTLEVLFAGPSPDFAGLDQVNLRLLPNLAGGGELPLTLTVDGAAANIVRLRF